jgi:hypothetical protein
MNRLKNYLSSRQLAEAYIRGAADQLGRGEHTLATMSLIKAMQYMITANNNLQSLAFGAKPRKAKL